MKKKLKILRVTTKPIALKILFKDQLRFINKFHDVIAISNPGKELKEVKKQEGVRTISLKMTRYISPIKDLVSLINMISILNKEKPDVVHSHTPKAGFISMVASALCGIPNRFHTVGGLPLMESHGLKKIILLFIEWLTYKCATRIFPNSYGLKKFILKNINVSKNKISVIGSGSTNGINTKYFNKNNKIYKTSIQIKKKFGLKNIFSFIFIGRIVKDKGIDELIEAFNKLNHKYKNTKLILIGWEENLDPISATAKKIIYFKKSIINLGYKKDVRPFLLASNCLVLPSYREGFPNVVLQAGSMNIPSIVSNINGCNEIIQNNFNGLYIKPKNSQSLYLAMEKILINKHLYKSLVKRTRKNIVKNFRQDIIHNKILSLYSELN